MKRSIVSLIAAALIAAAMPGQAGVLSTLSAAYDGTFDNTFFTITNTGSVTENDVSISTSLSGTALSANPIDLGDLAAGQSLTYFFGNIDGGFVVDPFDAGVPDTTTYRYSLNAGGVNLFSNPFSPLANLTGSYLDFLGNSCGGLSLGCSVAASGIVADVAVPEPVSILLVATSLSIVGALRRRRRNDV